MDTKLFDKNCITLDGCMDEPVWNEVKEYTDFQKKKVNGGGLAPVQTSFKIIPCEDRIYIGIKCMEPDMPYVTKVNPSLAMWTCDDVEIFLSPNCNYYDFYQFAITFDERSATLFYSEAGNIKPDPYAPDWRFATYKADDYWSVEVELPLTAFYMTADSVWNTTWLVNVSRTRTFYNNNTHSRSSSAWCQVERTSLESKNFQPLEGFPVRPAEDDLRVYGADVEIVEENEKGFCGSLIVKLDCPTEEDFEFTSDYADTITLQMKKGDNEFTAPCCFPACKKYPVALQLKRLRDGKVFKRYFPVRIAYEAIKLQFTKPEFRTNFYPGQDYSEVVGKVTCAKPITMKLEGAGVETQIITPEADGSFRFDTSNLEVGEALLTVTSPDKEITRKIRRLAPNGKMMSWISGGRVIVDGKPVFPRTFTAVGWHGGKAQKKRYESDDLHETRQITHQEGRLDPDWNLRKMKFSPMEANRDEKPREEIFQRIDAIIEAYKDKDFTYYYLSDEPECRGLSPVYLKYMYEYLCEKDPYHLVRIASREAGRYVDAGDFFETHPYINPYTDSEGNRVYTRPFETLGKYVDSIVSLNRPDKSIGFYGTGFGAIHGMKDPYPTLDELICNDWTGVIRGAKSLRHYAYHDLYDCTSICEGARYMFSTMERFEDILLFANRTTLYKTTEMECALYELNGEKVFVLVNFTQEPQTITLEQLSGTWYNFRHNSTLTGPTFQLKPIEVLVGTSKVRDDGMPTYQETVALVEKLEYERTHNGNLLFGQGRNVAVTNSGIVGSVRKLFDGVRENWAWEQAKGDEKFYEIDVSKVKPVFNKIVVSGNNIDNMQIRVRMNGELIIPPVAETQTDEFSKTFLLKEAIAPDAIRMEFFRDNIELCEFEIFNV